MREQELKPRSRCLLNLADWLAWLGTSTTLGGGEGLRAGGTGLSGGSYSSDGSCLIWAALSGRGGAGVAKLPGSGGAGGVGEAAL